MFQPDLFTKEAVAEGPDFPSDVATLCCVENGAAAPRLAPRPDAADIDLPALLERLAEVSARPRYTYMVLDLIARAAGHSNSAGPYVRENGQAVPIRDWLSDAMLPMAQRDFRRLAIVEQVRCDLDAKGMLPSDREASDRIVADEVRERLLHSGRTNVSRAVSDLVRAGLIHRHYQGYRVDHANRGAQREAVYTIVPAVQCALGKSAAGRPAI
jgi:hypothetical protein